MSNNEEVCCPKFDPEPWDGKEITWEGKPFVKDRVRSFLHIPLNFGAVMRRNMAKIGEAEAMPEEVIVLSDENSLWGSDVYIAVDTAVPDAEMVSLTGTFMTKVFLGPYENAGSWAQEMADHVTSAGKTLNQLYFYYTTCPKCAKKYGKNYVVLLAQV